MSARRMAVVNIMLKETMSYRLPPGLLGHSATAKHVFYKTNW